ncbi:hypothetical protein [Carnobacterium iners]|uniref:hypothetical protein n=1 Tax=Carnobacterium iners TaxID=1073423 RepID=UPI000A1CCA90|nr:hypothetical protein [Carnobacterium iners]
MPYKNPLSLDFPGLTFGGRLNEVILLAEGVFILDEKTQEKRLIEEIKAGTTVKVLLVSEPVTTRSLPPQIPGNSIAQILMSE